MSYQANFKRYELKYMLEPGQKQRVLEAMAPYMARDAYGRVTIRNLYLDTENYRLIRRSLEKPMYKEKMRIRSYERADAASSVFVELKKKYKSVVYKRRIAMQEQQAMEWICGGDGCPQGQIANELEYARQFYGKLRPAVFLSYEREAYYSLDGSDFRVTFDENILCRQDALSLREDAWGTPLLEDGYVLMELKTSGAIPLWMTHLLNREHLYKTSYSKYGTAYMKMIFPERKGAITGV